MYSQDRIDHGNLIRWTKGFGAPNTEGHDVACMLRDSIKKLVRISYLHSRQPIMIYLARTYRWS